LQQALHLVDIDVRVKRGTLNDLDNGGAISRRMRF
jgi:hypothetical protein